MPNVERSLVRIEPEDLRRMADTALARLNRLFDERPDNSGRFRDSLLMLCLAQGGGLHYVDGVNGLKDIDIIAFFDRLPDGSSFPPVPIWKVDYGESKFGRDPSESLHFRGRRMDIMGRSIDHRDGEDKVAAVQRYVASGPGDAPGYWRQKPGVAIWREDLRGQVIWRPA